jgi:hypothetical protein
LKINIISIIGAIIALIGIVLPWWTMNVTVVATGVNLPYSRSIYLYQTTTTVSGTTVTGQTSLWYGWAAFVFLVLGALVGIAFSFIQRARIMVAMGGILTLLSVTVFAVGLQKDVSTSTIYPPGAGLFSSGNFFGSNFTTYLSFGFWLALVGAIVMLVASLRKPKTTTPTAIPPPTPAQQEPSTTPS